MKRFQKTEQLFGIRLIRDPSAKPLDGKIECRVFAAEVRQSAQSDSRTMFSS
jgi:hypothetical protein